MHRSEEYRVPLKDGSGGFTVQHAPTVYQSTEQLFQSAGSIAKTELQLHINDYALYQEMHKQTTEKYKAMAQNASSIADNFESLHTKYTEIEPHLQEIDKVDESLESLEQTVALLDAYTRRLETKFKALQKSNFVSQDGH
eukprot:TRINITY_DN10982_c0_g1_i1.p1 TRINITY_DN10982_c0_g1~~TRINITY_DN10982_c0_g1_i1.p1  ORF type:complete len:140 (+),score=37.66 TRINITY_DN10982_c0_g1_i1:47-466(+)